MPNKKTSPSGGTKEEKIYTFTFNLPNFIGLCAIEVVALCAFFVLGVLLGRGYQPERDVPELAMVMPSHVANKTEEAKGGVLKPEELRYMDDLKRNPEPVNKEERKKIRESDREQEVKAKELADEKKAERASKLVEKKESEQKARELASKTASSKSSASLSPEKVKAGSPVFDYIYQIASFLDEGKATSFGDTLHKDGLNSYVESGKRGSKNYYRVFVKYTGTVESTDRMKTIIAKYGIKKPLLRSKVEK